VLVAFDSTAIRFMMPITLGSRPFVNKVDASAANRSLWRDRLSRYSIHSLFLTIGSHLCRAALRKECQVTSISRSGRPSANVEPRITYEKADIFAPENYRSLLKDATAVIYSAGILLEGDYKSLAQGKWNTSKALGLLAQYKSRNPLAADPKHPRGYDALNRDGGTNLGRRSN
jgi:hypothetical protein